MSLGHGHPRYDRAGVWWDSAAKANALKQYFDLVVAARNTHKVNIESALDDELDTYDINTLWP